jgi:uncharacterized membrane protein YdjX (TVP38/TMEM64 family)
LRAHAHLAPVKIDLKTLPTLALRAVGIAVPLVFAVVAGKLLTPWIPQFSAWVDSLGAWGPVVFVAAYVTGVVCMMPVFLLIITGGAVFGTVKGTLLSLTGALVGGTIAFLIARYVARGLVEQRVAKNPTLRAIDRVVGEDGLKLIFLLRLSPAIPYVLSNYALGVTTVRLRDYVFGTLGLAPIVAIYAAFGDAAGGAASGSPMSPTLIGVGIVVTVVLGLAIARVVQRAIKEAGAEHDTPDTR